MAESIFSEKATIPNEEALGLALKGNKALWDQMLITSNGVGEWKFYSKAAGWSYQVKQGKRALFYMIPKDGWFRLTFVYGNRAVEAAPAMGLPEAVLNDLQQATVYMEGRSVNLAVNGAADLDTAQKMLQLKLSY